MKKLLLILISIAVLVLSSLSAAIIITPDTQFIVGNQTYTVNATMVFSQIIIDSTYIVFNTTGFYLFSPNSITIKLVFIKDTITGAANGDRVLDFYTTAAAGTVWFNLSGFPANNQYLITRNGVTHATSVANASGFISYTNGAGGTQRFQFFQQAQAPVDTTPPQISALTRTTSTPLDTNPSFGWVNVSCTVTDNVAVSQVRLRIQNPSGTWNNVSMQSMAGGQYYHRSATAFSSAGHYSYHIWAQDTSSNVNTSGVVLFYMPPNWDVNADGIITILDLVLISNKYGNTGAPGWIREDVDNNGAIQILDLSLVSNHFGESW